MKCEICSEPIIKPLPDSEICSECAAKCLDVLSDIAEEVEKKNKKEA